MKLQFFHAEDLCRFTDIVLDEKPHRHIFNVGNKEAVERLPAIYVHFRRVNIFRQS